MAEVSDTVLEVQKIGKDLAEKYQKLEGMVQERASAESIKELGTQLKSAEQKYDDLAERVKQHQEEFEKLSAKFNRDASLFGATEEEVRKNFTKSVHETLAQAAKDGIINDNLTGTKSFTIKDGHVAFHRKAVGTITSGNLTDGNGGQAFSDIEFSQTVVTEPNPNVHIRQLIPASTMSTAVLQYPQFTGGEGAPGYQSTEGSKKPQLDYDWRMVPVQPFVIAATADVSRQSLSDISWLSGFMSTQMTQDLIKKEDQELLYGAGGGSAIHGLVPQATTFVAQDASIESEYDVIVDAIAQLEELEYNPSTVLLHPRDYAKLLLYKSTQKEYNHPVLVFNGGLIVNGVRVVKSSKIAKRTGLVGEFSNASLLVREGITFNVSYDNKDNFEKNMVTLRIEERIALAVYRPKGFVSFDFDSFTYAS